MCPSVTIKQHTWDSGFRSYDNRWPGLIVCSVGKLHGTTFGHTNWRHQSERQMQAPGCVNHWCHKLVLGEAPDLVREVERYQLDEDMLIFFWSCCGVVGTRTSLEILTCVQLCIGVLVFSLDKMGFSNGGWGLYLKMRIRSCAPDINAQSYWESLCQGVGKKALTDFIPHTQEKQCGF